MPIIPLLLNNWQLILKCLGGLVIGFLCYWYFVHNPKVIDGLERDKAELARMLEAKNKQITLYGDIEKGKVHINEAVQQRISSLRSEARPKRTVIIRAGSVLPALPAIKTTN